MDADPAGGAALYRVPSCQEGNYINVCHGMQSFILRLAGKCSGKIFCPTATPDYTF